MTSFGWKRKAGTSIVKAASVSFEKESKDEELDNEVARGEVDWLTLMPKRRLICLEDAKAKSQRLQEEGAILAQAERYWEAIKKWDEGLLLSPEDSRMLDMKAQALMAVGEVFPAVQAAEYAVKLDPTWWEARQTLGRALLNMGEVKLAVRTFCKAVMLNPSDSELWQADLLWACSIRDRMQCCQHSSATKAPGKEESGKEGFSCTVKLVSLDEDSSDGSELLPVVPMSVRAGRNVDNEVTENGQLTVLNMPPNYVHLRG